MKQAYKKANKFHRINSVQAPLGPRRGTAQNYYQQEKGKRRKKVLKVIQIIIVLLLVQSIFQIPYFKIDQVEITGLENAPVDQIQVQIEERLSERKFFIFKNNNYFLFSKGDLLQELENQYFLENASLKKSWPKKITFTADERISPFVRQTPDAYYRLSYTGETLGQSNEAPQDTIIIADEREDLSLNIPLSYLEEATDLIEAWDISSALIQLDKLHINDEVSQIEISSRDGYRVIFSTEEEYAPQLSRLEQIITQGILPNTIEYIDLRFENNVYFK